MIKLNKLARRGESNRYQVLDVSRQELGLANPHSSSNCDEDFRSSFVRIQIMEDRNSTKRITDRRLETVNRSHVVL